MNLADFLENRLIDSIFRGGAVNSSGAAGSTAVVKGIRTASTAYLLGDTVVPASGDTAAGGKFLQCTTAGTSAASGNLAIPNPGTTVTDGTATWTAVAGMPVPLTLYAALYVINKGLRANSTAYSIGDCISLTANGGTGGDTKQHVYRCTTAGTTAGSQSGYLGIPGEAITDGTAVFTEIGPVFDSNTGFPAGLAEVSTSGSGYARIKVSAGTVLALTDWAGTQSSGSTGSSTGTGATTSNNNSITYGSPTTAWANGSAMLGAMAFYDQVTGGNLYAWGALTTPKTVNSGDTAPSFAPAALSVQMDN